MLEFGPNWNYLFVFLFGLSTWITINGVFSQIPIFMRELPEGYDIPATIVLIVQLANILPLLYSGILAIIPQKFKNNQKIDTVIIYLIIVSGIILTILFGIFWNKSIFLLGKDRSVLLYVFVFSLGSLDCMTSIIYYPFISNYELSYMSALSLGSYSTGLVVGIVAFIQDPGASTPRFSVLVFSIILSIITIVSLSGFTLFKLSKHEKANYGELEGSYDWKTWDTFRLVSSQFFISIFENGISLGLVPYTFGKYPNSSQLTSWQINSTLILKPLFTYMAYKIPYNPFGGSESPIFANLIWIAASALQIAISLCFPNPPLRSSLPFGGFLVVCLTLGGSMMAFCKTKEVLIAQSKIDKMKQTNFTLGLTPLRKAGLGMQCGSLLGSIAVTILVYTYFV